MWITYEHFGVVSGENRNVLFATEVNEHYVILCQKSGLKAETDLYIIRKLNDVMLLLKIFIIRGKYVGRERAKF